MVAPQPDPIVAATAAPPADTSSPADGADKPAEAEPTLLEKFDATKADPKAAEKPAAEAAKVDPAAKPAEAEKTPAPELTPLDYFAAEGGIKLPETISMNDEQRTEFSTALDAFRADPTSASAQKIVDMGTKMMSDYAEHVTSEQFRIWNDTRKGWQTQVMADPILGGAGHQTAMAAVADVRDKLVPEADRPAFNEMLRVTGVGDHPAFLRMLQRGARFFKEAGPPPPDPRPTPDAGKRPGKRGAADIYTNTNFK